MVFQFSGQGAQYPGMMKYFYDTFSSAKRVLDTADEVLGRKLSKLIFNGTREDLSETTNTQPAVLAADLMALAVAEECGLYPDAVAGFSLGEYAALAAAGVLDLETVFGIVQKRAEAMKNAAPEGSGGMAAIIGKSEIEVAGLCSGVKGYVIPVNFNCPGQITVSGEMEAVDALMETCKANKIRAMKLPVSVPCHCKFMDSAALRLEKLFENLNFKTPAVPVYMNVDGKSETDPSRIKEKLVLQVKSPVLWTTILGNMSKAGQDTFIELGPGKTLTNFVKRTLPEAVFAHMEDEESLNETLSLLKRK